MVSSPSADPSWGMRNAKAAHSQQNDFLPGWMDEAEKVNKGTSSVDAEFRERVGVEPDEHEYEGYDNRGPAYESNALGLRSTGRLPQNAHANQDAGPDDGSLGQGWKGDTDKERYAYGAGQRVAAAAAPAAPQGTTTATTTGGFVEVTKPALSEAQKNFKQATEPVRKELSPGIFLVTAL